ncbi:MAG: hypothetical protein ACI8TQ_000734 [Planctomycetota bacterium]|jgi:hypothetical protein
MPMMNLRKTLVALLALLAGCSAGELRGSVHGADGDREPIPGVAVIRHTSLGTPLDRNQTYSETTTDLDGNFQFSSVWGRHEIVIAVKDGWYPHASGLKTNFTLVPIPNETVTLHKVDIPVDGLSGYSLARGIVVPKADADFVIELIPGEAHWAYRVVLRSLGAGGFASIGSEEVGLGGEGEYVVVHSAFLRATGAPLESFSTSTDPRATGPGWFVRSRDGKHYGKLLRTHSSEEKGDIELHFYLAFQPNGSRNLATAFDAETFLSRFFPRGQ